jgi:hypothetical protein
MTAPADLVWLAGCTDLPGWTALARLDGRARLGCWALANPTVPANLSCRTALARPTGRAGLGCWALADWTALTDIVRCRCADGVLGLPHPASLAGVISEADVPGLPGTAGPLGKVDGVGKAGGGQAFRHRHTWVS